MIRDDPDSKRLSVTASGGGRFGAESTGNVEGGGAGVDWPRKGPDGASQDGSLPKSPGGQRGQGKMTVLGAGMKLLYSGNIFQIFFQSDK